VSRYFKGFIMGMKNNIKEFKTLLKGFNKKLNEAKVALAPTLEKAKETTSEYQEVLMKKGVETFSRAKVKINQIEKNEKVKSIIEDATKYIRKVNSELEQEMQKINKKTEEKINNQDNTEANEEIVKKEDVKVEEVKPLSKKAPVRKPPVKKSVGKEVETKKTAKKAPLKTVAKKQ